MGMWLISTGIIMYLPSSVPPSKSYQKGALDSSNQTCGSAIWVDNRDPCMDHHQLGVGTWEWNLSPSLEFTCIPSTTPVLIGLLLQPASLRMVDGFKCNTLGAQKAKDEKIIPRYMMATDGLPHMHHTRIPTNPLRKTRP